MSSDPTIVCLWVRLNRDGLPAVPMARRGDVNEAGKPQSYCGVLQPPVHGKVEGRAPATALLEECLEEGGPDFAALISMAGDRLQSLPMTDGTQPYVINLTEEEWQLYSPAPTIRSVLVVMVADIPQFRATAPADKAGTTDACVTAAHHLQVLKDLVIP